MVAHTTQEVVVLFIIIIVVIYFIFIVFVRKYIYESSKVVSKKTLIEYKFFG